MEQKVIAVIGCGRIAKNAHMPAFEKIDEVRIKYACDLIEEKALAMKEKFPKIENVITDYRVALADPEVVAVWVLTPNYAHYTVTMDALKAGKHVFCEKPITINYALSCEMAEEAKKQNKRLAIGVCNRYHKSVELLKEYNDEGKFGNIYHIYCSFRSFRSIPGLGGAFTDKAQSGGGVLIDWGVHFFDLIMYILGDAKLKSVTCDAYSEMAKDMSAYKYEYMWAEETKDLNGVNDVDDLITGYIRTDKGTISFNGAWAQNIPNTEMLVDFMGDKAGARLDYATGSLTITRGDTLETVVPPMEERQMHHAEDRDFLSKMRDGVRTRNDIPHILESMKLLDLLYQSAKIHEEIKL